MYEYFRWITVRVVKKTVVRYGYKKADGTRQKDVLQYEYTYSYCDLQGCIRYGVYRGIPPVLPVPDASVSSVRHQYRYRTLRQVRHDINSGTGHFGKFGTTTIPVPDTLVSSARPQYRYRTRQ